MTCVFPSYKFFYCSFSSLFLRHTIQRHWMCTSKKFSVKRCFRRRCNSLLIQFALEYREWLKGIQAKSSHINFIIQKVVLHYNQWKEQIIESRRNSAAARKKEVKKGINYQNAYCGGQSSIPHRQLTIEFNLKTSKTRHLGYQRLSWLRCMFNFLACSKVDLSSGRVSCASL